MEKGSQLIRHGLNYTKNLVCKTKSNRGHIIWFEYLVEDEQDFRAQVLFYFRNNKEILTDAGHIKAINQAIEILNIKENSLCQDSNKGDWVKVYWQLYIIGFIKMCYNRTEPTGMLAHVSTKYIVNSILH
ncbi:MAG: hypothetical protein Q9M44_01220 [Ghiorsea sp.]|nr:hypothetical protein [Ghiorsea sp.]